MSSVVLVIPCYNEEERLDPDALRGFAAAHPEYRVLFVDDGSTDGTAGLLEATCSGTEERLAFMRLGRHSGKAEAVRSGVLHAFGMTPRAVGFWDADLSTPLIAAPEFLAVLDERPAIQLVTGARVQLLGREIQRSALRHYIGRMFAALASLSVGLRVYDTQCGAKLFRATPEVRRIFEEPFHSRWAFDVEILARLGKELGSMRAVADVVYELPLREWIHAPGSKVGLLDFPSSVLELLRIRRERVP
jgi:glycosyltransferase involved in cell wall biosynthesis